jgi:hypothetical protein
MTSVQVICNLDGRVIHLLGPSIFELKASQERLFSLV